MSSKVITGDAARAAVAYDWEATQGREWVPARVEQAPDATAADRQRELSAAWEEGYRQGRQEGVAECGRELEETGRRTARSIAESAGMRSRLRCEVEREAVALAVTMARRILRREVHVDPEALRGLCKAAFEKLNFREATVVRVHPRQRDRVDGWVREIGCPARLEVQGDGSLEEGAFVVETTRGMLDGSVDTQLDEIERGFADLLPAG